MPIRPELRKLYPWDWKRTVRIVKAVAGHACEGSPLYPWCRAPEGLMHPDTGSTVRLTVAHMDHDVRNNSRDNLRALCQRCHLAHDEQQHMQTRIRTQRTELEMAGQLVFLDVEAA